MNIKSEETQISFETNNPQINVLKTTIIEYKDSYEARFIRNQYTNNAILGLSIILTIFIVIIGTSSVFKNGTHRWANPLGMSASAWLGLISTALISIQKLYNIQEKIAFYPGYIVQAQELIEDLDKVKTEKDIKDIEDKFRKMRRDEANNRPVEKPL
jgi:uncharacterized integral membrane protein